MRGTGVFPDKVRPGGATEGFPAPAGGRVGAAGTGGGGGTGTRIAPERGAGGRPVAKSTRGTVAAACRFWCQVSSARRKATAEGKRAAGSSEQALRKMAVNPGSRSGGSGGNTPARSGAWPASRAASVAPSPNVSISAAVKPGLAGAKGLRTETMSFDSPIPTR